MRVALATLGCKVNQYDSAVYDRLFRERGWRRVSFDEVADAYVVNTCTVTDRADAEARRLARRARRRNPQARVILTGCYAQVAAQQLAAMDCVDYVVGLGRAEDLLDAVAGRLREHAAVSDLRRTRTVETLGIETFPGRTRAFVKVQEGCDLFCSFCIIPIARGPSRSVPPRRVVEEVARLEAAGYREVVLTGIHLGGYGRDLEPPCDLPWLLEALAERVRDVRIRISSIDPPEVTPRLLAVVRSSPVFCRHLHVAVQSGSDTTLERMRRTYRAAEALEAFERIRDAIPDAAVGTDLIAGFPGETEDEFADTVGFLECAQPAYAHVFPYSRRASTSAAKRWPELPRATVLDRAARLRSIDRRLRRRYEDRFVGRELPVLFERDRQGRLVGRSDNYLRIRCEPEPERVPATGRLRVTGRRGGVLVGTPV